jgi:hypothetical protein
MSSPHQSKHSKVRSLLNKVMSKREMGIFEATLQVMQMPYIRMKNIVVEDISLGLSKNRMKKLKNPEKLNSLKDESTDLYEYNYVENYYPNRPHTPEFDNLCLYDVKSKYTIHKGKPNENSRNDNFEFSFTTPDGEVIEMHFKKRTNPIIISPTYMPSTNTEEGKKNYITFMIQLYKPWRTETDIIPDHFTTLKDYVEHFENSLKACLTLSESHNRKSTLKENLEKAEKWMAEALLETNETNENHDNIILTEQQQELCNAKVKEYEKAASAKLKQFKFDKSSDYEAIMNEDQLKVYNDIIQNIADFNSIKK